MSLRDPHTQLPTEALFEDRLGQALALARRKRARIAVVQIAVDGVGQLDADNALLVALARRLEQVLRSSDTVGRVGGHDFTVLLNDVDSRAAARAVAEEMALALSKPVATGDQEQRPAASYGLALFPDDGDSEAELLQAAEAALRRAQT